MKPYFIGVGNIRSGSTWCYNLIIQHPEINENKRGEKELKFFDSYLWRKIPDKDINAYFNLFPSMSGEWTPAYLHTPMALQNVIKICKDSKILLTLRNPINKMHSHVNCRIHSLRRRSGLTKSTERDSFWITCLKAKVADQLEYLFNNYDRNLVHVIQYEKMLSDTSNELKKLYRFLNVDDSFVPNSDKKVGRVEQYIVKFDETERHTVKEYFKHEVSKLKALVPELDISLWSEFA